MLRAMETTESLDPGCLDRLAGGLFEPFWQRTTAEAAVSLPGLTLVRWQRRLDPAALLTPGEFSRFQQMKHPEAADLYGQGRSALRFCGSHRTGCRPTEVAIGREANGKPFFEDSGLPAFNKSHSHGNLAIGFNTLGPIGIDLECIRRRTAPERLAERYFHPTEAEALRACDPSVRNFAFLALWVCKEASLKLSGEGLAGGIDDARVVEIGPQRALVSRGRSAATVSLQLFQFDEFLGAIATEGGFPVANWAIAD